MTPANPPLPPPLILIGGGGHSLVVAEAALLLGHPLLGFFDDFEQAVLGAGVPSASRLGGISNPQPIIDLLNRNLAAQWIVVIGDAKVRRRAIDALAAFYDRAATIVHPAALISPTATLAKGVFVGPRAVVHTRARIGPHCIVNTGCIVEHECELSENVHSAPGSVLGGRTRVGRDTLIGIGARSLPGAKIGAHVTIGAGAMVLKEVPDHATAVGVPARIVTKR